MTPPRSRRPRRSGGTRTAPERRGPNDRRLGVLICGALLGLVGAFGGAVARSEPASSDSLLPGGPRASYWGPLPAPGDSSAVGRLRNNTLPVWEAAVVYPWRVLTFPVKLATTGLGAGLVALDESGAIKKIGRLISPPPVIRGFTPSASAGGAQGTGLGGALFDNAFFGPRNEARLRYEGTFNNAHKASFGVRLGKTGPRQADFVIGYRIRPAARYFGLGPESNEDDNSFYTQELGWFGAELRRQVRPGWMSEIEILGSQTRAGGSDTRLDTDEEVLADRFAGRLPAGYRATSRGFTLGLGALNDNTTETGRPEQGGVRRLKVTYFKGYDDIDTDFWTFHIEAQQFVPLWFSKRALAVRGLVSYLDPTGRKPIPFQRLNYNDDPDLLRGYKDFRFRDQGLALLNAEYRWPIWADRVVEGIGLDMYLLTDVGQVFSRTEQISLDNLRVSYGAGFRFIGNQGGLGIRVEVAHGDEGTQFRLRTDQVFQFVRDGLFHGRNPIPSR